ncbi:hypothetical protein MCA1606 [Methylococcus capsulatus str. Bath]|uniref:Uncharacterized protein n=1 Tax=Methylococcus capsulatus (strain ATCC 33009 / NCIMB 11132 / Bath) TaxID=243233 RepID=Q607Z2_METCA|nr:hypothetical protein [Methylococcus capsulatus]AAU92395.1 hypothetical protein MCA1606 [Methylococcus capsulatus str. Bath]
MTPPTHRSLWRADFAAVPPVERRLARYALQLFRHDPQRALNLSDHEVLGALWRLTAPLLDPRAARELMGCSEEEVPWAAEALESETLSREEVVRDLEAAFAQDRNEPARPAPVAERRQRCRAVFETLPQQIARRLAEADGVAPTSSTVATLGQALGLSATEVLILDYLEYRESSRPLRVLLRAEPGARYATRAVGRLNRGYWVAPRRRGRWESICCFTARPAPARRSWRARWSRLPECAPTRSGVAMTTATG